MSGARLKVELEALFPNISSDNYDVTSPVDDVYNCIAYAAHANDDWWWPTKAPGVYWPLPNYMEETLACFVAAYVSLGYKPCENASYEEGCDKVAVYANEAGKPTHAARQLKDGTWTSKLGRSHDIRHKDLSVLEGLTGGASGYGKAIVILSRSSND